MNKKQENYHKKMEKETTGTKINHRPHPLSLPAHTNTQGPKKIGFIFSTI